MYSRQHLRELISDRLTVAAEEIFRAFELTIDVYEEELDRQRKLFERKPRDVPQQQDRIEKVLTDQYLCDQEGISSLDHVHESVHIKEDNDEIPISREEQQLVLKQEAGTSTLTLDVVESGQTEAELSLRSVVEGHDPTGSKDVKKNIKADQDNQHKLLDYIWKPQIKLQQLELSQLHVSEKEDFVSDHQLCQQHKNQNHQKISICQKSLSHKDKTNMLTSYNDEEDYMETETDSDHRHLSPAAERQNQTEFTLRDSGSLSQMTHPEKMRKKKEQNHHESNIGFNTHKENVSNKCETCGKTFPKRSNLNILMRIHTGEKPFCCETCRKCFSQQPTLTVPRRTHTGEKPFPCDTCGKCFPSLRSLRSHMRTHSGEKPFSCETCSKRFSFPHHLSAHQRTHTGEKPYSCETCGKCFTQHINLKVHMRTHTGEKPYPCETCGKRFSTTSSRNVHTRLRKCEKRAV